MSEELLINVSPVETRVALVENGVVQELHIERSHGKGYVGNIYKGKVVRVLPGMQAAFVEIGLARTAFIHASDMAETDDDEGRRGEVPDIRALVREGQTLLVQVSKDPIGTKGARLTTNLSLSSRYLVYMPNSAHIGVSTRIDDDAERQRLRGQVESLAEEAGVSGGFILRTVAEGVGADELRNDIDFLQKLWLDFQDKCTNAPVPSAIHTDMPLFLRALRDLARAPIEKIRVDSRMSWTQMREFATSYYPELVDLIECYSGERPLLDLYGVEDEIARALDTRVPLKSNGYLIVEQTEAMTTVDVNTGAFVGRRNLEETIFKTNMEAASAIVRQLRLRNLGGIIILDFIDMKDPEHERQVLRTLEKALEKDHAKTSITGVSELGLVEMTRKRTRESLGQMLCEPCPLCSGRGLVKSAETVCYEIFREILREARAYDNDKFLVLASQLVVDRLLDEEAAYVADLEAFIGRTIEFQVESLFTQEQYDIVLV
ncbi:MULTISPECIES: ribonuclease G [Marinimicrobium]|jgi:ribonuclease G|uniref:Ribonuclease G n=1 Tax=Marinimicrobium koreense TaxID=306545 RepID=A0A3N1NZN4_9GAMM|nr:MULTISPECIES: ribonuclease G [Marinimicrobium]MAN53276.1 ribonuclease G [Marinimicrobium sp.]ROQ20788.1 RNAse G [Marinimicrobium koreense]